MSGNLRLSMLIEANFAQARREVAALRGETDQLGAAAAKAGQGAKTGGAGILAAGEASKATGGDFLRTVTAAQTLDSVVGKLSASMARIGPATFLGTLAALGDSSLGIDEIAADFRQATDEAQLYKSVLDQVRAKYDPLFAVSQRYETELRGIAEAEEMGALSALGAAQARERAAQAMAPIGSKLQGIGQSAQQANAYIANLGFQANDIFVMLAAGQNPMMLAIQQGTQIAQVFVMMRKEGQALGPAIGSALMGMVNPISLVTIAAIALGGYVVQSFLSVEGGAAKAKDAIAELSGSLADYKNFVDTSATSTLELTKRFGDFASQVKGFAEYMEGVSLGSVLTDLDTAIAPMKPRLNEIVTALRQVAEAKELISRTQIMVDQGLANPADILVARDALELFQAKLDDAAASLGILPEQAGELLAALDKLDAAEGVLQIRNQAAETLAMIQAWYPAGDQLSGPLATIASHLNKIVTDTAEAAGETLSLKEIAGGLSGLFVAADGAAAGLATTLARAAGFAWSIAAARAAAFDAYNLNNLAGSKEYSGRGEDPRDFLSGGNRDRSGAFIYDGPALDALNRPSKGAKGGGAKAERDALAELVAEQMRQIEALKILDPVQAQILKHHEALANATEAERAKVEALVAERMRLEEVRERLDAIEQAGKSAFTGLITGAYSFSEALSMVLSKLVEMAASDVWDLIWGGGSGGGGIGSIIGSILGLADGGKVSGPGGPRDDRIPALLSDGEFVVNAAATAANQPLLEAVNAGVPISQLIDWVGGARMAFADGGMVGGSAPASWRGWADGTAAAGGTGATASAASPGEVAVRVYFDSRKGDWTAEVQRISGEVSAQMVSEGLDVYNTHVLPDRMAEIQSNPRMRGR